MEPLTLSLLIGAPLILTAVYVINRQKNASKVVKEARMRALTRQRTREFADTEPMNDRYGDLLPFNKGIAVKEDSFSANGLPLTKEQLETIDLIFKGFSPPIHHRYVHKGGPAVTTAAGVPVSNTAFDELNAIPVGQVEEYLDPSYVWPE